MREEKAIELRAVDGERRLRVSICQAELGGREWVDIRGDYSLDQADVAWLAGTLIGWLSKHQAIDDDHVSAARHIIERERRS